MKFANYSNKIIIYTSDVGQFKQNFNHYDCVIKYNISELLDIILMNQSNDTLTRAVDDGVRDARN